MTLKVRTLRLPEEDIEDLDRLTEELQEDKASVARRALRIGINELRLRNAVERYRRGALSFGGMGLLVASRAKNTQTASGLMNLVMMPMFVLSGVFFSARHFPEAMQPAIRALPLTALNDSIRAIMNDGAGLAALWPKLALLLAVGLASFAAALKLFRWT